VIDGFQRAKPADIRPIFRKPCRTPADRCRKRGRVRGNPGAYGNPTPSSTHWRLSVHITKW